MLQLNSKGFCYSKILAILLSQINFNFLRLLSRNWSSAREAELRMNVVGNIKGSKSLKQ